MSIFLQSMLQHTSEFSTVYFQPITDQMGVYRIYKPQALGSDITNHRTMQEGFSSLTAYTALAKGEITEFAFKSALQQPFKGQLLPRFGLLSRSLTVPLDFDQLASPSRQELYPFYALVENGEYEAREVVEFDYDILSIKEVLSGNQVARLVLAVKCVPNGLSWLDLLIILGTEPHVKSYTSVSTQSNCFNVVLSPTQEQLQMAYELIKRGDTPQACAKSQWMYALQKVGIFQSKALEECF